MEMECTLIFVKNRSLITSDTAFEHKVKIMAYKFQIDSFSIHYSGNLTP